MTMNNATPESDEAASSASAEIAKATGACVSNTPDAPRMIFPDTTQADGLAELDELLSKIDNLELISIRRLFNMC